MYKLLPHPSAIVAEVPARKIGIYNFIALLFLGFATFAIYGMVRIVILDGPLIAKFILFILYCIPVYLGITAMIAFLWIHFGREVITVSEKSIQVQKFIFRPVSTQVYDRHKVEQMYVNADDYLFHKISKGRNDFLAVFRFGTIHFTYAGKLIHIAGGMTDAEGQEFLQMINRKTINVNKPQ